MRVLIVDDEPAARERLHIMLEELDVEVAGEAANGVEAIDMARTLRPDVLLLDIAMPEVDGFDVLRHLDPPRPFIIFQTAHDQYALDAFEHAALDYVVKPVTLVRLRVALERARERVDASRRGVPPDVLARLEGMISKSSPATKPRLLVRDGRGYRLLALRDIDRFAAAGGLAYAHTGDHRFLTDYTLAEIEDRTGPLFVRASRSELVNIDRITGISGLRDGSAMLTLENGSRVRVSRRRAAAVRTAIES
jgi:two-component system LytT family response regulator